MDIFVVIMAYCLCGWLALRIGQQKVDKQTYDWQTKVCGFIFGPFILIAVMMEHLKRKKRAQYTPIEQLNKKDIYTFWDWFIGNE